MITARRLRRGACLGMAFLLGLVCGTVVSGNQAGAAQQFRPEDLDSVPKSFLEGGGKSHTVLGQILQEIKKNGKQLEKIEQNSRGIEELGKTVQEMNLSLQDLAKDR
jgi:hypothetical protein